MNNQPIATNLHHIKDTLPGGVTLVAVSKFHPAEAIAEAYEAGQRVFGESRVQELTQKVPALPAGISWHFIGHLQSNKVRQLLKLRPAMIESVDTERLLNIIDEEAAKEGIVQRLLLQLHVAKEETKFGFSPEELIDYFTQRKFETLKATHICGVMGMASNTDDRSRIVADFTLIADTFKRINEITPDLRGFNTLSMGMSHDYPIALECGATMVRVGSAIFGDRY
jgi:hypothetical protein